MFIILPDSSSEIDGVVINCGYIFSDVELIDIRVVFLVIVVELVLESKIVSKVSN